MRLAVGVVLASVVLFFFGFLFWGISPLPYTAWTAATDEPGAREALRRHFPTRGTYFIPAGEPDMKAMDEKFQ